MLKHRAFLPMYLLLVAAAIAHGQAATDTPLGAGVERQLPIDQPLMLWAHDPERVKTDAGDTFQRKQVSEESFETIKLKNVIPPIRFDSGAANIPESSVERLRKALDELRDHKNVRVHLVGHADNQRLSQTLARNYGDNAGLSRERAGQVAEFLQRALNLPAEAISYEWAGDTHPIASNETPEGRASNRRVEVEVWYDQPKARAQEEEVLVHQTVKQVKVCRIQTLCTMRFKEGAARRERLTNLVPPLHYEEENAQVSPEFLAQVHKALSNLQDKQDVVVKFIGYTDNVPLSGRDERIYADHIAYSKAKAHRVALAVQEALKLPGTAVASDGRGYAAPVASNDTAQGRATNRRVEVQFWYDEPLQELPEGPQLCPRPDSPDMVTKVYDPPWASIPPLQLQNGRAVIPPGYTASLRRAMADISDRAHVRLRFIGYTANDRLDRRAAAVYGDDVGLSAARARRAMEAISQEMHLTPEQAEHEGRGYVQSTDVVNSGFTQGDTSYVVVQVVYDEPAVLDDYEGVSITRMTRELTPRNPFGLNPMHITVDGVPIDDPNRSSADVQRCTDVALERADIKFQFDNLKSQRRLSVAVSPGVLAIQQSKEDGLVALPVRFRMYNNYGAFIDKAEVRIFDFEQSAQGTPLAVVAVDVNGNADWQPDAPQKVPANGRKLKYLLRAYAKDGRFDDTKTQTLWVIHEPGEYTGPPLKRREPVVNVASGVTTDFEPGAPEVVDAPVADPGPGADSADFHAGIDLAAPERPVRWFAESGEAALRGVNFSSVHFANASLSTTRFEPDPSVLAPLQEASGGVTTNFDPPSEADRAANRKDSTQLQELLAGYGESSIALENIRVSGGTVTVHGGGIPPQHTVWVAGHQVPVDQQGNFVAEEVLPPGTHTVEVAVLDQEGNGSLYLRDLEFKHNDRFFVAMADLTASKTHTTGPAELYQGANAPYSYDSTLDGSLSFFGTEKFGNDWRVTASADTREGPVHELFSNFLNKAPDSLFRRIDPDYYYPTFGDDSVVQELAPTLGKFYVKVDHDADYALWGNYKINYAQNELAQVNRGLYGANAHWQSDAATPFGEQRMMLDGFAAQPGTIASREQFRGTGGSLYFLHNQDILTGSESVWIELHDKDSALVTGTVSLRPSVDYEIDYLQGRILLTQPLSSIANDNLLVRTSGLSGQEAYLVVRYEYTPGLQEIHTWTTGGQGDLWLNDYVKLGLTGSSNDLGVGSSGLRGADVTVRKSADSWVKLQGARTEGLVSAPLYSADGGYGFTGSNPGSFANANATGYRADASLGFGDLFSGGKGRLTLFTQNLDAGYSAPGLESLTRTEYYGGTFKLPVGERLSVNAKIDRKAQDAGLTTEAEELDVGYKVTKQWAVSTGVRKDDRTDNSPIVPLTQEQGERTDAVAQLTYDSLTTWRAYTFVQDTVARSGDRDDNGRVGVGGSYRLTNRLSVAAEASQGDLGPGGKLGTTYMYSDRTTLYVNYSLENERGDTGLMQRQGNLISGMKTRWSDSASVYVEERYQDINQSEGLTHATGVTLTPNNRWNIGVNTEIGTLVDSLTDAQTKRKAGGVSVGYVFKTIRLSSGVEFRDDQTEAPDTSFSDRRTWLFRNNCKYQLTPDWRLVGKLDHSMSNSSQGQFYDGGYTEAVIGYGYRPVKNDQLDVLAKYTYFYNVPTPYQMTPQESAAQYIQKSHIASLDVTYDLTQQWSVGGKYAYRLGQASLGRVNPQFFDNTAELYIARADWRFRQEWEGMIEARMLRMPDLNEARAGALVALYRIFGKHVKAGVGYNFTNFSEDLTDLSYRQHGIFMNVVGSM
jgi:flagellar motor protein MotB